MGLSTHVLDTMHGCPAAGMQVTLYRTSDDGQPELVRRFVLNADGRPDGPLFKAGSALQRSSYRFDFEVGVYFAGKGIELPVPNFLGRVAIDFGIAEPEQHYHVPLLVSPWSYSTYRGS